MIPSSATVASNPGIPSSGGHVDKEVTNERKKFWGGMTQAQAAVLIAIIAIVPPGISGILSGYVSYKSSVSAMKDELDPLQQSYKRISAQIPQRIGYQKHLYPTLGLGLLAPLSWSTEDAAAKFAGGEFDLVKRYEDTKGIVGMKFRIRSVQKNYINDIQAELKNQKDVWEKIDPNVQLLDTTINGKPAKLWKYNQRTGKRIGDIRWYWLRLVPEVKLEIIAFIYTDSFDRKEFWNEVDDVIGSLVFDEVVISERRAALYKKKLALTR